MRIFLSTALLAGIVAIARPVQGARTCGIQGLQNTTCKVAKP